MGYYMLLNSLTFTDQVELAVVARLTEAIHYRVCVLSWAYKWAQL